MLMSERRIGRPLLAVTGALEAATGLGLLLAPSMIVEFLLGAALGTPAGATLGRVTGIALLAIGVACWLARDDAASRAGKGLVTALLLYNIGVVAVLAMAGVGLRSVGLAFWPVVLAHAGLTGWCVVCLAMRA